MANRVLTLANSVLYDSALCELPGLWDLELPGDILSTAPKETPQHTCYSLAIIIINLKNHYFYTRKTCETIPIKFLFRKTLALLATDKKTLSTHLD